MAHVSYLRPEEAEGEEVEVTAEAAEPEVITETKDEPEKPSKEKS